MKKSFEFKKFIWDTTQNPSDYPRFLRKIYFQLFLKYRKKFSLWNGKLSVKNSQKIYNLIKLPYSRDPFKSNLFKNALILIILKNKKININIKKVIFENESVRDTYLSITNNNQIEIKVKKNIS